MTGQYAQDADASSLISGQSRPADPTSPPTGQPTTHQFRESDDFEPPNQPELAFDVDANPEQSSSFGKANSGGTLRRSQACLACRKRKLRCDARKPTCTRCERAWLAYHPSSSSSERPPPCEYDTSLLAKIFGGSSSEDSPQPTASQSVTSSLPHELQRTTQKQKLVEENEELRSQISHLRGQLGHAEKTLSCPPTSNSSNVRFESQQVGTSTNAAYMSPLLKPPDCPRDDTPASKRPRHSHDSEFRPGMPSSQSSATSRKKVISSASRPGEINSTEPPDRSQFAVAPSVMGWRASVTQPVSAPALSANPQQGSMSTERPPRHPPLVSSQTSVPPLPDQQMLNRLLEVCRRESWLFLAINTYALSDVAALLETTVDTDSDVLTAQSLMMACIATGLPMLASLSPSGVASSPAFTHLHDMLVSRTQSELPALDNPVWITTITQIYGDGARYLLNLAQSKSAGFVTQATFVVRLLLVDVTYTQSPFVTAQADLAAAASESRLLRLQSAVVGACPCLSAGQVRSSHLARALRGLMQSKEEEVTAFWSLFIHDCVQSRLAHLPVLIERESIRIDFPCYTEDDALSPSQRQQEVHVHLKRLRGLPFIEFSDNPMSLLVKVMLVLDRCCEYNIAARGRRTGQESDKSFLEAHESIRSSRMMLSQFDDQTLSRSELDPSTSRREQVITALLLQDKVRFAAEMVHHLAVLLLFETEVDVVDPFAQAREAQSMLANAAIWISRLAEMALQNANLLWTLPSFCSTALFLAARWLLYLQAADPEGHHCDLGTLVLALSRRGECFSRDREYAKAVVALKREILLYGRVCISPFTWPTDAVSEFMPAPGLRRRQQGSTQTEKELVSIVTLAASIDEAAVLDLAHAARS